MMVKLKSRIPWEMPELKTVGMAALLILAPLFLNVLVWKTLALPAEARSRNLKDLQALVALKPKFESLLLESDLLLNRSDAFDKKGDPTRIIKQVQEMARESHVQIAEIHVTDSARQLRMTQTQKNAPGFEEVVVMLEVEGSYHKLARWIHALEGRPDLRVENFSMRPAADNRKTDTLSLELSIFMRNS